MQKFKLMERNFIHVIVCGSSQKRNLSEIGRKRRSGYSFVPKIKETEGIQYYFLGCDDNRIVLIEPDIGLPEKERKNISHFLRELKNKSVKL